MFLLGLEGVRALAPIAEHGMRRGDSLRFRLTNGRGHVIMGGAEAEVRDAVSVARAYLEYDFVGAILREDLTRTLAAGARTRRGDAITL